MSVLLKKYKSVSEKAKLPKLMKKLKKNGDRSTNKEENSVKLPKIMKKVRDKA